VCGTNPGVGLRPVGAVWRPLRRPHGAHQKGHSLDMDRHEGDHPHCARDTRAWKNPRGEACHSIPLHEGDAHFLRPLPQSNPPAARPDGPRSGPVREVPPCEGGSITCPQPKGGAGGRMVQGSPGGYPYPEEARPDGPHALPPWSVTPRPPGAAHRFRRNPQGVYRTRTRDKETR